MAALPDWLLLLDYRARFGSRSQSEGLRVPSPGQRLALPWAENSHAFGVEKDPVLPNPE